MIRPLALDFYCGAGGAGMGLYRAGFDVIGVDIEPHPDYPFAFVQADALLPPFRLSDFDFIWASPPCQDASVGSKRWQAIGYQYPRLIGATRALLQSSGRPWCIENVPGAEIRPDLVLVGPMFGLKTWRRRHFELSGFFALGPAMPRVEGPQRTPGFCTVAGHGGNGPARLSAWREAMGIDWMNKSDLKEAVPPAYSEYIGRFALRSIEQRSTA